MTAAENGIVDGMSLPMRGSTEFLPLLLQERWATHPDAPAILTAGGPTLTCGGLAARTASMGQLLSQAGTPRSGYVVILLENGSELAAALVSVIAHAVAVPLDPRLTAREMAELQARIGFAAILTIRGRAVPDGWMAQQEFPGIDGAPLVLFSYQSRPAEATAAADADSLALVYRTSGTTQYPKLVPVRHRDLMARIERISRWLSLTSGDRALGVAKLHYCHGLETTLLSPLAVGGHIVCPWRLDTGEAGGTIVEWLMTLQPTYFSAGPASLIDLLERITAAGGPPAHSLRFVQTGGAPLPERAHRALEEKLRVPLLVAYGLTEIGQLSSNAWLEEGRREGTVGRPDPGAVALLGEDGNPVAPGAVGEVAIQGTGLATGYLDEAGHPQPILEKGWFHTGDLAQLDDAGFLTLTGRIKDIINRGGEKISPLEIDAVLLRHPDVVEAAAFPVPHQRLGEDVSAAVVLRSGSEVTAQQLRHFLRDELVLFKIPRRIEILERLPKGNTGKILRAALTQQFSARPEPAGDRKIYTPLESQIIELWARLLGRETVNPTDEFFEIGGDSLLAVQMLLELEQLTGQKLPEAVMFDAATPRQLADAFLAGDFGAQSKLIPIRSDGHKPALIFFDGDLNGGGYYVRRIAANLDEGRPLWVLRPFEADGERLPSYEDMGAHYLSLLREAGLNPPYLFGGYCNGALMAIEVARQAEASGAMVDLIVMIDPVSLNARPLFRGLFRTTDLIVRTFTRDATIRRKRFERIMAKLWGLAMSPRHTLRRLFSGKIIDMYRGDRLEFANRMALYHVAMASYIPSRTAARIVCITPQGSIDELIYDNRPWTRFGRSHRVINVPGNHQSCLTNSESNAVVVGLRSVLGSEGSADVPHI